MNIRFILKNGAEFSVRCDKFSVQRNSAGELVGYEISGITKGKPLYVDLKNVSAIIRTNFDEEES